MSGVQQLIAAYTAGVAAPTFANMPRMNAAMAANTPAVMGMVGNSLTAGYGATITNTLANAMANSAAKGLNDQLTTMGFNTSYDCFGIGDRNIMTSVTDLGSYYGGLISGGSGWSYFGFTNPWGANALGTNTGSANLVITPRIACDKVQVFYRKFSGFGTLVIDRGGAAQNIATAAGADGFGSTTLTFPLGTQNININCTGGFVLPLCFRLWNSSTSRLVLIDNMGVGAWRTSNWMDTSTPSSPFNALPNLGVTAIGVELGVNDKAGGVSAATYQSNMTSIANQIKTGSAPVIGGVPDVFFKIPNPGGSTGSGYDFDATWKTAVASAATASSLRTSLDLNTPFSPQSSYTAQYSDTVIHLNSVGYLRAGQIEAAYL